MGGRLPTCYCRKATAHFLLYLFIYKSLFFQKETISAQNTSNKLYTQLTISSKTNTNSTHKETKVPAQKKRRSSTSDKPNNVTICDGPKKSKVLETCDIYNRNNLSNSVKVGDNNSVVLENNGDKKNDGKNEPVTTNGKSFTTTQVKIILWSFILNLKHPIQYNVIILFYYFPGSSPIRNAHNYKN